MTPKNKTLVIPLALFVYGTYSFYQAIQPVLARSLKWRLVAVFFLSFALAWLAVHFLLSKNKTYFSHWQILRAQYRMAGIVLWLVGVFFYVFFFQYTRWGVVFGEPGLRLLLWFLLIEWGGLFLTDTMQWLDYRAILKSLLLSGTIFVLARAFSTVVDYPFWLGWSEGNRMWDFSLLFGRHLYNYPIDQSIRALIDPGRQLLWGLIFLLPNPTIVQVRFWNALMFTLPLLVFGWVLFHRVSKTRLWFLVGIWVFVFLYQGPIYSQLIVAASLVALAWRRPLWASFPLLVVAGYFAHISRWTWMFAPAMWILLLEFAGASPDEQNRVPTQAWKRSVLLTLGGLLGGVALPFLQDKAQGIGTEAVTAAEGVVRVSSQPLLWYRLWPNPTYGPGILPGLLLTIAPVILWLIVVRRFTWRLSALQRLLIWGEMLAFAVVGLIASTKIGGGSNLHNLDMFLIGLVFLVALAWESGGEKMLANLPQKLNWQHLLILAMVLQPIWQAPLQMSPLRYDKMTMLNFFPDQGRLPPSLPEEEYIPLALQIVNDAISNADGDILFMDHRQLLTFGYVPAVPLVPEYEKKMMMNEAMGGNAAYFSPYYRDLENRRFALIITEPLVVHYQTPGEDAFAEENNAWMYWVAEPTLCYYEPIATLERVHLQILVPRNKPACSHP